MADYEDLQKMIEILDVTIAIHAKEEEFFRRSAEIAPSAVAKNLYREISEDLGKYRESMEKRRRNVEQALRELQKADQRGAGI